jgi:sugar lactone lactonase YvrE
VKINLKNEHHSVYAARPAGLVSGAILDGPFGPNGLRVNKAGDTLYFAETFDTNGGGIVYTLPIKNDPRLSDLKVFHTYTAGAGPDSIRSTARARSS